MRPSDPANLAALERALRSAVERKCREPAQTEAIRLLNARASGIPRLVFELYGRHGILFDYGSGIDRDAIHTVAPEWCGEFGWESVSWLDRTVPDEGSRTGNHAVTGTPPEELVAGEGPLRFRLEPRHPRNVGLFLDTRVLRQGLARGEGLLPGARMLNLFAYTGSLGIAALHGGAGEVVQVDVSARYLDWGRANLELNGLPAERCRFTRMDSERYLEWAAKKDLRFGCIVLDPPVFARFDGKVFRFERDYFRLVARCLSLLEPGGMLHAVTNYSGIKPAAFGDALARTAREAGVRVSPPRRLPLPEDYDLPPDAEDLPEGNAILFTLRKEQASG